MALAETRGIGDSAPGKEVQRLFFALWPDATTRLQLAQAVDGLRAQRAEVARWTAPDRYHLTLQFLGDYAPAPPGLIDAVCTAAASVRVAPFVLMLDCAGSFRNHSIPWWLGCSLLPDSLHALWGQLGAALHAADVRYDTRRAFSPHLTILRDARDLLPEMPVAPVTWSLREFVLVESRLGGVHSGYTVLRRFPLRR